MSSSFHSSSSSLFFVLKKEKSSVWMLRLTAASQSLLRLPVASGVDGWPLTFPPSLPPVAAPLPAMRPMFLRQMLQQEGGAAPHVLRGPGAPVRRVQPGLAEGDGVLRQAAQSSPRGWAAAAPPPLDRTQGLCRSRAAMFFFFYLLRPLAVT